MPRTPFTSTPKITTWSPRSTKTISLSRRLKLWFSQPMRPLCLTYTHPKSKKCWLMNGCALTALSSFAKARTATHFTSHGIELDQFLLTSPHFTILGLKLLGQSLMVQTRLERILSKSNGTTSKSQFSKSNRILSKSLSRVPKPLNSKLLAKTLITLLTCPSTKLIG